MAEAIMYSIVLCWSPWARGLRSICARRYGSMRALWCLAAWCGMGLVGPFPAPVLVLCLVCTLRAEVYVPSPWTACKGPCRLSYVRVRAPCRTVACQGECGHCWSVRTANLFAHLTLFWGSPPKTHFQCSSSVLHRCLSAQASILVKNSGPTYWSKYCCRRPARFKHLGCCRAQLLGKTSQPGRPTEQGSKHTGQNHHWTF